MSKSWTALFALFTGGALACGSDPSVNVTLTVTISNGTTLGDASAVVSSEDPSSSGSGGSNDAGRAASDGGAPSQLKLDAANQDGSPSSTCQTGTACDTGTIVIEAGVNHCPVIVNTMTAKIDANTFTIVVPAGDLDGDRLSYEWSATSGHFSAPSSFQTTFTCDTPGTQTLTVVVSDGSCPTTQDISIVCPPPN